MGWVFFLADLKTYHFWLGRGGRCPGGSADGMAGEVVMAIEVLEISVVVAEKDYAVA